nr:hypothetical protein [Nitrosomonas nitrosa]
MSSAMEVHIGEELEDLGPLERGEVNQLIVRIPLQYIGSAGSYLDICQDIVDLSWVVETLAALAGAFTISDSEERRVTLTLTDPLPAVAPALRDCDLYYTQDSEDDHRLMELSTRVGEHEDSLPFANVKAPHLADWYFANLVFAANYELRSEHPEAYEQQMVSFPERQVGYFKSARSAILGGACYSGQSGWLLGPDVDLDHFFEVTRGNYRLADFAPAEVISCDGVLYAVSDTVVCPFPLNDYTASLICAGFAAAAADPDDFTRPFDWLEGAFKSLPRSSIDDGATDRCLIDATGSFIIVERLGFRHLLYDIEPTLSPPAVQRLSDHVGAAAAKLNASSGMPANTKCDWSKLSDDDFELLCYDLICALPQFDADTVRKLGKSRSRDGGRDIEALEASRYLGDIHKRRKWIFQCKLIKSGSALGGSRVVDIGDMLERYKAGGFGVLTSTLIDATLYDKLDELCGNREIAQFNRSVLELERDLARFPSIRRKYFPD